MVAFAVAVPDKPLVSVAVSELPALQGAPTVRADVAPPPMVETVFGSAMGACCAPAPNVKSTQNTERTSAARQNLRSMTHDSENNARLLRIDRTGCRGSRGNSLKKQNWSNL